MPSLSKSLTVRAAITSTSFNGVEVVERPDDRLVKALVCLCDDPLIQRWFVVWQDDAYDAAGQWNDSELFMAIKSQIEDPSFVL